MSAYELALLVKPLQKSKLVSAVKKAAETIIENKGYVEKIDYLGTRILPYRMYSHTKSQTRGSYFLIHYHAPYEAFDVLLDEFKRDMNYIRPVILPKTIPEDFQCTLNDEMKPAAFRPSVKKMVKEAEMRTPKNIRVRLDRKEILKKMPF